MSDQRPGSAGASRGGGRGERSPNARTGSVVAGRYQVDKLIARGGMATVYLAHQVGLERHVALKILAPPPDADDAAAFESRFHLEARSLASLNHTNIVTVYDFGETDDGRFYLAMEYIDGPKFSDLLRDGPLSVQRAIPLIIQVCIGLRYAHKRHVVHRDLKPSNILVKFLDDGEPLVKLVDFGLVKLTIDDQTITRAGLILGSPHCMAPEQVRGVEVDERADIYAVGVLLFRSLTGHYPFHGPNSAATMIAHLNEPVPTFFSVAPHIVMAEGLEDIVRRCLAKDPRDRFQSMNGLMEALAACMQYDPQPSLSQSSMAQQYSGLRSPPSQPPTASSLPQAPTAIHQGPSGGFARPSGAFPSPSGAHSRPANPYAAGPSGAHSSPSRSFQGPAPTPTPMPSYSSAPRPPVVYTEPSGAHSMASGVRIGPGGAHVDPGASLGSRPGAYADPRASGYFSGAYSAPQPKRSAYPLMLVAFGVGVTMFLGTLVLGAVIGGVFGPAGAPGTGLESTAPLGNVLEAPPTGVPSTPARAAPRPVADTVPIAPAPRPRRRRTPSTAVAAAPAPAAQAEAPPPSPPDAAGAIAPAVEKPNPEPASGSGTEAPEGYMGVPDDLSE